MITRPTSIDDGLASSGKRALAAVVIVGKHLFDCLGHRSAHVPLDRDDNLLVRRLRTEEKGGRRDDDDQQRGDRENAVVGQRRPKSRHVVRVPFLEGVLQQ